MVAPSILGQWAETCQTSIVQTSIVHLTLFILPGTTNRFKQLYFFFRPLPTKRFLRPCLRLKKGVFILKYILFSFMLVNVT